MSAPPSVDLPRAGTRDLFAQRGFVASLVVALIVGLGFGLVVPIIPTFARSFGVSVFAATALVSVFAGVRLVSNLIAGPIADVIGPRRAVAYGAWAVGVSSAVAAAAPNYAVLVAARGAGGFGSALFFNALLVIAVGGVPAAVRGRAIGLLSSAFLLGIALGPSVGGALAEPLGLRWPFVIYAVACLAAGAVAFAYLPSDVTARPAEVAEPDVPTLVRGLVQLLRSRELVAALVMYAALRWALTGVRFSIVPLFGDEVVGASTALVGVGLTLAAGTHLLLAWPAGRMLDVLGRRRVAIPSFAAFAVCSAALALATSPAALLVMLGLYGVATGLTAPIPHAIVGDVVEPNRVGSAMGVVNTAGDVGSVLGPVVSGFLVDRFSYDLAFLTSAVVLLAGTVAALRMRETHRPTAAR